MSNRNAHAIATTPKQALCSLQDGLRYFFKLHHVILNKSVSFKLGANFKKTIGMASTL